jgi:hypothetical protein
MKQKLILVFVFVSFTLIAKAQGNIGLHVGASFPLGEFAADNSDYSGSAGTGLNVGIKYFYPVSTCKGLSLTAGIDFLDNGLNQNAKDNLKNQTNITGISNISINYSDYINIPLLVGFNYNFPVDKTFTLFGDAALGVNYSTITDLSILFKYQGTQLKSTETFTPLTKLAFQFGGGLLIQNTYTIGLHYNMLGSYSFKTKTTNETSGQSQTINGSDADVKINTLTLEVGIRF